MEKFSCARQLVACPRLRLSAGSAEEAGFVNPGVRFVGLSASVPSAEEMFSLVYWRGGCFD